MIQCLEATPNPSSRIGARGPESPLAGLPILATTPPIGSYHSIMCQISYKYPCAPSCAQRGIALYLSLEQHEGQMAKGTGSKAGGELARPVTPSAAPAASVGSATL